ncbi:MAG: PKD domain-containing protein [Bacteroidetes bacterium]|nr:PKD domain-containing protein [Bacteroidota bacterium]
MLRKNKPVFNARPLADSTYTIPVVIHVIYPDGEAYGSGTNISYAQIRSQIEALNAAFSRNYPSYNGQAHPSYAQDTRIKFCLARITMPDSEGWATGPGGIEYGVKRYPDKTGAYNHLMTVESAVQLKRITHKTNEHFPFDKYLNIWIVKSIAGENIMGYAPKPLSGDFPLDGIVIRGDVFGDNTTGGNFMLNFGLTQGKILVHEMGHYLNLYHIFQNGCSGANAAGAATDACDLNGDFICDIKPCTTQNVLCSSQDYNTCHANYNTGTVDVDMINDYMSYADDDCMNTFTLNQSQRMWATLNLQRFELWQPGNLAATGVLGTAGCIPPYLNAAILVNNSTHCAGTPLVFSNPVQGNTATSYQWSFPGGNPATANTNSVQVVYPGPGNYTATLSVTDGVNTREESLSINVIECKLDSSLLSMSHWYFGNFCSLDFSSGVAVATKTAFDKNTIQGESSYPAQPPYVSSTISLSDSSGNLLFYSNGVSVWNNEHKKISDSPIFGKSDINASTGLCYIPFPGHPGKYFIAGSSANLFTSGEGIRFVSVDINTNTVTPYQEFNHPLLPHKFSEFLTVVPHCNGTDYWIITKGYGTEDTRFFCFLVTSSGINAMQTPVISSGFKHPGFQGSGDQLKANRRGDKLLLCSPHGYVDIETAALYDFNNRTGEITNEQLVPNVKGYSNIQGGGTFSPSGEFFYLMRSTNFETNGPPYWLFQYRTSDLQYNVVSAPGFYFASPFQLGPDNQIYVTTQDNFIARIANPDKWGEVMVDGSFLRSTDLNPGISSGVSIPSFIDAALPQPTHPEFSAKLIACNTYSFNSLCFDNYTSSWDFGDGSPMQTGSTVVHTFTAAGKFKVGITVSRGNIVYGRADKEIEVLPLAISIMGPDSICTNYKYPAQYFAPSIDGVKYNWSVSNGSLSGLPGLSYTSVSWLPSKLTGILKLEISRDSCTLSAEKIVAISTPPVINWPLATTSICNGDGPIVLEAMPVGGKFSGVGISGNTFFPDLAGIGEHKITYSYPSESFCASQAEKIVQVWKCSRNAPGDCFEIFDNFQVAFTADGSEIELKSSYLFRKAQVYNLAGQRVTSQPPVNNKIHIPFLSSGVYLVVIYCEDQGYWRTFKVVKLN